MKAACHGLRQQNPIRRVGQGIRVFVMQGTVVEQTQLGDSRESTGRPHQLNAAEIATIVIALLRHTQHSCKGVVGVEHRTRIVVLE